MADLSGVKTPPTPSEACVSDWGVEVDVIDTPPFSEDEAESEEVEEDTKSEDSDQPRLRRRKLADEDEV